jgi:predicted Ser/Thr protein kinase
VVERGLADRAVVDRALLRQKDHARKGVFRRLGEVLVEQGTLEPPQVLELLALQGKAILVCPNCLAQYNVDQEPEIARAQCARCALTLAVPETVERLQVEDDLARDRPVRALELASAHAGDSERLKLLGDRARFFGPYEIMGEISRGGMGVVYKARQPGLDRVVALKVLLDHGGPSEESVIRFQREARAVARLRHPNIVAVHDVGTIDGVNYFSMDFVDGLTLDRAVTTEGLDHRRIADVFAKVCDAVQYAHQQGVIHRDLKPRNIIIDKNHEPCVIDFGIARMESHLLDSKEAGQLTKSGEILGSPAYLAPEYITGEVLEYDAQADVWSLGACIYAAITGRAPHADADTLRIIRSASTAEPPHIRTIQRNVERDLGTIIMTALERRRPLRYPNARELGLDLRRWLDGQDIGATSTEFKRWWRRVRPRVTAGALLALATTLVWSTGYLSKEILILREQSDAYMAPEFLREQLGATRIRIAELLLKDGEAQKAEHELSEAIPILRDARRAQALRLRAKARRALGNSTGATQDEFQASSIARPESGSGVLPPPNKPKRP